MSSSPLRLGLWSSLIVVAVAVYLRLQQPLQDIFISDEPSQTFCFRQGITAKFSAGTAATCFTIRGGIFVDVFTPKSDLPSEAIVYDGHAIPGLWDGVSGLSIMSMICLTTTAANNICFDQHGHLQQYGEFLHSVDLFGSSSFADVRERLASYLAKHEGVGGKDEWIRGVGWDQMALGGMPTAVRCSPIQVLAATKPTGVKSIAC